MVELRLHLYDMDKRLLVKMPLNVGFLETDMWNFPLFLYEDLRMNYFFFLTLDGKLNVSKFKIHVI